MKIITTKMEKSFISHQIKYSIPADFCGVACHALDPPRHTNNPFKDCTALFQPNKDHHYQALNVSLVFHNLEPSPLLPTPRILPLIKVRIHIDTSKLRSIMHDVLR